MLVVEATSIPTAAHPHPVPFFRATVRTETEARQELTAALVRHGMRSDAAHSVALNTESVWTDFPAEGVTARIAFAA